MLILDFCKNQTHNSHISTTAWCVKACMVTARLHLCTTGILKTEQVFKALSPPPLSLRSAVVKLQSSLFNCCPASRCEEYCSRSCRSVCLTPPVWWTTKHFPKIPYEHAQLTITINITNKKQYLFGRVGCSGYDGLPVGPYEHEEADVKHYQINNCKRKKIITFFHFSQSSASYLK